MREIKFRGKRVDNGKWVYGWLISDVIWWDKNKKEMDYEPIDPKTVGQYICEKDKKNIEIYEGDIVEWYHDGVKYNMQGEVKWKKFEAQFVYYSKFKRKFGGAIINNFGNYLSVNNVDKNVEVIGNIHENSELLETA